MPTQAGQPIPAAMTAGGPLNPFDWLSLHGDESAGIQQGAVMRGHPGALAYYQRRQIPGPATIAQSREIWLQSPTYDRGAAAFAPKFGHLNINPIGAGIYAPYKLPAFAGPGARYQLGAIWFDVQSVPTTMRMSPTMSSDSLNALLMGSHVAAMYATTG
jgi:hypothetical protein